MEGIIAFGILTFGMVIVLGKRSWTSRLLGAGLVTWGWMSGGFTWLMSFVTNITGNMSISNTTTSVATQPTASPLLDLSALTGAFQFPAWMHNGWYWVALCIAGVCSGILLSYFIDILKRPKDKGKEDRTSRKRHDRTSNFSYTGDESKKEISDSETNTNDEYGEIDRNRFVASDKSEEE